MKFLLDTNTCIFVIRSKPAHVLARFQQSLQDDIGISSITLAELRYGADKSARPAQNHAALDAFLVPLSILDFDSRAAEHYGIVRVDLERRGTPIGPLDTMSGAHALSLRLTLVTNNVAEFSRVTGLKVADWTAP